MTFAKMDRAFVFHTEVSGSTEIVRDGVLHGERIHNDNARVAIHEAVHSRQLINTARPILEDRK